MRSQLTAWSVNFFLLDSVSFLGSGNPVRLERDSKRGSLRLAPVGLLFRNQFTALSAVFFFVSEGTMPGGKAWLAILHKASTVGSSRFCSILGLFLRSHSTEDSPNFFLLALVGFLGNGNPVKLDSASIVGPSSLFRIGSLLRSQLTEFSKALFLDNVATMLVGRLCPARLAKASTTGSSRLSNLGLLLRSQLIASCATFFFSASGSPFGLGNGSPVKFERTSTVELSRFSITGSLLRSQFTASSTAFLRLFFGTIPGGNAILARLVKASTVWSSRG